MTLKIGDTAPDFEANTTQGKIKFHDWIGDHWAILFSHPKDFTPVCTTELGYMAKLQPEFDKRNIKIIGLSVDPVGKHSGWAKDIEETQGSKVTYPMIGDDEYKVSKAYGMLPAEASGDPAKRTANDNQTVRNVFIIGPDKKIKLILVYPMSVGRNFDEVLRVLDALQLTAKHKVSTPVNWKNGEDVIIAGSVNNDDAKKIYPQGWKEPKPYIRIVPQPRSNLEPPSSRRVLFMKSLKEKIMDKDRIEGSANQAKGAIKEAAGKVTGDAKLQAEGKADKAAGKVQNAVGGVKDAVRDAVKH